MCSRLIAICHVPFPGYPLQNLCFRNRNAAASSSSALPFHPATSAAAGAMEFTGAAISAPFGCRTLRWGGQRPHRAPDGRRRRVSPGPGAEPWTSFKVSCVATEKHDEKAAPGLGVDFADEEDYVKGGGGELLYVQMQATKAMESQSKIASKLLPIADETSVLDLVIIGCGPAGLSLAAESAKKGLTVGLIGPDLPFTNNYGVWEDEFKDLGLESCIEHVWKDTVVYLDRHKPIMIGRAYGRVDRDLLHEELLRRCNEAGVTYLNSKVDQIIESPDGHRIVYCEKDRKILCRLAIVASGAASGKLLEYEVGGPRVCVQTAYGVEVEVERYPYDPSLMVFMDYRDCFKEKFSHPEEANPTFLYAMAMSSTRVFFEETCLASKDAMPFDLLKKRLMSRLDAMGVRILKVYEEEWSYIPVGGSLPNTDQKNLAFGAAASMVHPATGYSVVRSLSEAPRYACVISDILRNRVYSGQYLPGSGQRPSPSMLAWRTLWPQERKRQRSFFLFGLSLIIQLDNEGIQTFFETFFRLPKWMWRGFLGSTLSSVDLMLFALYMFAIAPNNLRMNLVRHLLSDPTGSAMLRTYLTL